jgi:hypothetical protein
MAEATDYITGMLDRFRKTKSAAVQQDLLSHCCMFIEEWASEAIRNKVPLDEASLDFHVIKDLFDKTIDEVTAQPNAMKQNDEDYWLGRKEAATLYIHFTEGLTARDKVVSSCKAATEKLNGGKLKDVPADVAPHLIVEDYMEHLQNGGDMYSPIGGYFPVFEVHFGSAKQAFLGGIDFEDLRSNKFNPQMTTNSAARILREYIDPKFDGQIVQIAQEMNDMTLDTPEPSRPRRKRPKHKRKPKPKSERDAVSQAQGPSTTDVNVARAKLDEPEAEEEGHDPEANPQQADEPLDDLVAEPQIVDKPQKDEPKTNVFAQVVLAHLALHSYGLLRAMLPSAAEDFVRAVQAFAEEVVSSANFVYRDNPNRSPAWKADIRTLEQFAKLRSSDVYANAPLTAAIALLGIYKWMSNDAAALLNFEGRFAGVLHAYSAGKDVEAATVEPIPAFEQALRLFRETLFPGGKIPSDETQHVFSWFMGYIESPTEPKMSKPKVPNPPVSRFEFIHNTILGMACPEGSKAKAHMRGFLVGDSTATERNQRWNDAFEAFSMTDFELLLNKAYEKLSTQSIGNSMVISTNLYVLFAATEQFIAPFVELVKRCEYII